MDKVEKHSQLKIEDFVKVKQIDGPITDRLDISGQVVGVNKDYVQIKSFDGIVGLSLDLDEYKVEIYKLNKKPAGWDKYIKNPESFHEKKKFEPAVNRKAQVFRLVKNNPRKKLESLLKDAEKEIGGDIAVLKSYVELALLKFR